MSELIRAEDVSRTLKGPVPVTLVRDISLTVRSGEFMAVAGPSGSGKSSLLYLLGLLDDPSEGRILIDGRDTSEMAREEKAHTRLTKLGFVFQFHFLLTEFSAMENVMLPMRKLAALTEPEARQRAREILIRLDLEDCIRKRPDQMSGGQRQRVAIARALANQPKVLLADEPTGNLDSRNAEKVYEIFSSLASSDNRAIIVVTHDQELASRANRRVHLVDGRIVSSDPAESVR